jgi:hypothetical protein
MVQSRSRDWKSLAKIVRPAGRNPLRLDIARLCASEFGTHPSAKGTQFSNKLRQSSSDGSEMSSSELIAGVLIRTGACVASRTRAKCCTSGSIWWRGSG